MADAKTVIVKIKRRKDQNSEPYWEEFEVPHQMNMNVISLLMEVRKNPSRATGSRPRRRFGT